MEKLNHAAHVAKTVVLFAFILMIPFISYSMRTSYLYFILNLLILVLAMESGILTSASDRPDDKKHLPPNPNSTENCTKTAQTFAIPNTTATGFSILEKKKPAPLVPEKPIGSMADAPVPPPRKLRKIPSRPSLFFIGGFGDEEEVMKEEVAPAARKIGNREKEEEKEVFYDDEDDDDDLFTRAEAFIGNFYKQLKIQREESWKKIHGYYKKPL